MGSVRLHSGDVCDQVQPELPQALELFLGAPSKIFDGECSYCCTVQIKWTHRITSQSKALAKTHDPAILLRPQSICSRAKQKSSGNIFQLPYYDSKPKFWIKDERPALSKWWAIIPTPVFWVHLIFTVTDHWQSYKKWLFWPEILPGAMCSHSPWLWWQSEVPKLRALHTENKQNKPAVLFLFSFDLLPGLSLLNLLNQINY